MMFEILRHDEIMRRILERLGQRVQLRADGEIAIRLHDPRRHIGMGARQLMRQVERRRLRLGGAEQNFIFGIMLREDRCLRIGETWIGQFDRQNR